MANGPERIFELSPKQDERKSAMKREDGKNIHVSDLTAAQKEYVSNLMRSQERAKEDDVVIGGRRTDRVD